MLFNQLPQQTQTEVSNILKAYNSCTVYEKANGDLYATNVISLHNGEYDKVIGEYNSNDVFTLEQQIINYVEQFRDFPFSHGSELNYTGKKDWKALNSDWDKVEMINGDLVFSKSSNDANTIDRLERINKLAEKAYNRNKAGYVFVGAVGEAKKEGLTVDNPDYDLFVKLLAIMFNKSEIWLNMDNTLTKSLILSIDETTPKIDLDNDCKVIQFRTNHKLNTLFTDLSLIVDGTLSGDDIENSQSMLETLVSYAQENNIQLTNIK